MLANTGFENIKDEKTDMGGALSLLKRLIRTSDTTPRMEDIPLRLTKSSTGSNTMKNKVPKAFPLVGSDTLLVKRSTAPSDLSHFSTKLESASTSRLNLDSST